MVDYVNSNSNVYFDGRPSEVVFNEFQYNKMKQAVGFFENQDSKYLSAATNLRFNRFKFPVPDLELSKVFSHVFFTRPDLNILEGGTLNSNTLNDPLYEYIFRSSNVLLQSLVSTDSNFQHDFLPMLSNAAKSFEIADEYIDTDETGESFTGFKVKYGKSNVKSMTGGSFSITYKDDKQLNIYKLHKVWTDYISKVYRGEFIPRDIYYRYRILDYPISCYFINTAEDGETILFWSKYIGVFPTNTSSNVNSWAAGNIAKSQELSISYDYSFKEDFNPYSLVELNINSRSDKNRDVFAPLYNRYTRSIGDSFVESPVIVVDTRNDIPVYKLKYKEWGGDI